MDTYVPEAHRKIQTFNFEGWEHHRSGWKDCIAAIRNLHHPGGVMFDPYLDGRFTCGMRSWLSVDFCGFFHLAPRHPPEFADRRYTPGSSVEGMLTSDHWKRSESYCKGIWTVSPYLTKFIRTLTQVPVSTLWHPSRTPDKLFSFEKFLGNKSKMLILTGDWLRKFETIYLVTAGNYHKCILRCTDAAAETCRRIRYWLPHRFQTVNILNFLPAAAYDDMMSQNVVFLDLHDVCACNTVIDCMVRNTPLLVRKLEGIVDYLGEDYPLYYECIEEANRKLTNFDLICKATKYLENLPVKNLMTLESFADQFRESQVYRSLPSPSNTWVHPRKVSM